jgi:DNA-binding transcriptional LysR family regulator
MELRQLIALVAAVEAGGIAAASRRLNISQATLSQSVNALERELRVKLLERSATGVCPTEAGLALMKDAKAILARRDQALQTMAQFSDHTAAVIRIGVPVEADPADLRSTSRPSAEKRLEHNGFATPILGGAIGDVVAAMRARMVRLFIRT